MKSVGLKDGKRIEWGKTKQSCRFKYVSPVCPLKCVLAGAAYYEGLVPILNAYTWNGVASDLCPEYHSCGLWEFMEWNVQGRFFRAADKPVNFSALYPRSSKHKKGLLGTWRLLQTPHCKPTENQIYWLIHSIFCILNNCQSFIKNLVNNVVILFCLGFELQEGVYCICFLWGGA